MNLKFCDRCGVQITDDLKKYILEIKDNDFTSETYQCVIHKRDLCNDCKKAIESQCRIEKFSFEKE